MIKRKERKDMNLVFISPRSLSSKEIGRGEVKFFLSIFLLKQSITVVLMLFSFNFVHSQPSLISRKLFDKIEVFQDYKNKNLYYFAPSKILLATETDGKPKFSLLSMRFTGTSATGNAGEKRFLNLVQFTVKLDNPTADILKNIKEQLGRNTQLKPMPIRIIETQLVAGFDENKEQKIASSVGVQQDDKQNTTESYWTERIMTFRVENYEAQLLMEQLEKKRTVLSLNYAFFAEVVGGFDASLQTKSNVKEVSKLFENIKAELPKDTILKTQAIAGDALRFEIDVQRWQDLLKKVDLNEEVPPAYPLLEVKCYDFTDNLRPDLYMKTIEIRAVGVNGQFVTLPAKRFMKSKADIYSLPIQFPFAVRMYKPLSYRVTEYLSDGSRMEGNWISRNSFTELIDITTPLDSNKISRQTIEIEIDPVEMKNLAIDELKIDFVYWVNEKENHTAMSFKENAKSSQTLNFVFDKIKGINFTTTAILKNDTYFISPQQSAKDDYFFVPLKDVVK